MCHFTYMTDEKRLNRHRAEKSLRLLENRTFVQVAALVKVGSKRSYAAPHEQPADPLT